jgi:hypothetical protein
MSQDGDSPQYVEPFLQAMHVGDVESMNTILEEHPSIVEEPPIESRLLEAYTMMLRFNPPYANTLYQAVRRSSVLDREENLARFEVLDALDSLKQHPHGTGF